MDDDLWTAAKFTVIARPDSRIVMASTPWGRQDRFFAVTYRAGQRSHSDDRLAGHESSTGLRPSRPWSIRSCLTPSGSR
jgi:hypothetical protein